MLPLVLLLLLKITLIIQDQDLHVVSCKCVLLLLFCISVTTDLGILTGLALEPKGHLGLCLTGFILLGVKDGISFPVSVPCMISTKKEYFSFQCSDLQYLG